MNVDHATATVPSPQQLGISHSLPLHNSGAMPQDHEILKWPSYIDREE